MAVSAGHDYAIARKTTWTFESGIGKGTAVVTPKTLFIFPHLTIGGTSRTQSSTEFTIGGQHPMAAIEEMLSNPEATRESIEEILQKWSSEVEGPVVESLSVFKRVKIFTGWLRRSIVLSKKEKGFEFGATAIIPKKDELQNWIDIFKDFPNITIK
ncbi:MAG: hypothetical protein L3J82_08625 [Planctomycetes bacterium]|nr:hypothetical protein [Planctomycetota bacterium]